MAIGMSIHVGINKADSKFNMTPLNACVHDAVEMEKIAKDHKFTTRLFTDDQAKFDPLKQAILEAAQKLKSGDIFLFTFSGHGSGVLRDDDVDNGQDEAILLHDCILIDDYISRILWSKFEEGVRILGVADCCHGGSVFLSLLFQRLRDAVTSGVGSAIRMFSGSPVRLQPQKKDLTSGDRSRIREASKSLSEEIDDELAKDGKDPKATILTLSACNDSEKALDGVDGNDNGAFTKAMLEVLGRLKPDPNAPPPPTSYEQLKIRISDNLRKNHITTQHPTLLSKNTSQDFLEQAPFTV